MSEVISATTYFMITYHTDDSTSIINISYPSANHTSAITHTTHYYCSEREHERVTTKCTGIQITEFLIKILKP